MLKSELLAVKATTPSAGPSTRSQFEVQKTSQRVTDSSPLNCESRNLQYNEAYSRSIS